MPDRTRPPHDCPGGCGAQVPHHLLACRDCWWELPAPLRNAFRRPGANRLTAVGEALAWYRANMRDGVRL